MTKEPEIEKLDQTEQTEWTDLKNKAKTAAEDTPPHWNPNEGDWLLGTITSTGNGTNNRFVEVKVAENSVKGRKKAGIDDDEKPIYEDCTVQPEEPILLWESTVLEDFFDRIKAGTNIAVQFTGRKQTRKGGNATKLYDWSIED